MREETKLVYTFDELTDAAKARAVDVLREKLGGPWWDSEDNDNVGEVMVYTFAEKLRTPGWDTFGPGDFPGINGVGVDGWSLDRGQSLAVSGKLDRDNAPALPWVDGIGYVELSGRRSDSTLVTLVDADPDCVCAAQGSYTDPCEEGCPSLTAPEQAVRDALSAAWSAGESEAEYMTGEERAREVAPDHEFSVEGEYHG